MFKTAVLLFENFTEGIIEKKEVTCTIAFLVFPQVGPNNVHIALSLVEYKPELQKAMEFVFGTTFVCDNMDNAKKVAFDKRIMTRTVTLGGDVFDPHGTLSGGKV